MQNTLLLSAIGCFLGGVAWRTLVTIPKEASLWLLVVGLVLALQWRKNRSAIFAPLFLSLCFTFLALGIIRTEVASWRFVGTNWENLVEEKVQVKGVIISEPEEKTLSQQFILRAGTERILVTTDRVLPVRYGDEVRVSGLLNKPTTFVTDLGRDFNYAGYLKAKGIRYRISLAEVVVTDHAPTNMLIDKLLVLKSAFVSSLERVLPEPAVGLGKGLLLGVKSALGEEIENDFRRSGIIHIVVLSGYNVMLVVAFIMYIFSFFLSIRGRVWAGGVAIVAFATIVGFSATVLRASLMAVLVLVAQVLGRQYDVTRALLLAGVTMIMFNPYLLIYDIGFQLSFVATLGLILVLPWFGQMAKGGLLGWREFLSSTIATQIAVLPLLLYHIGEVSLVAVLINLLVLPIVPLAMLLTFAVGVLGFVSATIAGWVGYLATFCLNYILTVAHFGSGFSLATVTVSNFPLEAMIMSYVVLAVLWWWLRRGGEKAGGEAGQSPASPPAPTDSLPPIFR